jgi:hypothetical protein
MQDLQNTDKISDDFKDDARDSSRNVLNLSETAEYFGVSLHTIKTWATRPSNPIPGRKVGGRWYFHRPDLEQFLIKVASQ